MNAPSRNPGFNASKPPSRRQAPLSDFPFLDEWVARFFRWPLLLRITIWMLGAYACALPVEWVVGNYDFERCLRLGRGYLALGLVFYVTRLLAPSGKTLLKRLIRSAALKQSLSLFKRNVAARIGIEL